ncbi:hypothetical protein [Flavobacterium sp.]|uniref:hypothetical protein n=1 Tax=Flavobacterium sp. TaxID=239 RepID=UPI0035B27433
MSQKHLLIYYENGKLINITPRKWARKNKVHFPKHSFIDKQENHPTTDEITKYLEKNYFFGTISNGIIAIHYNLNLNLNF